jgi:hypothetical protein
MTRRRWNIPVSLAIGFALLLLPMAGTADDRVGIMIAHKGLRFIAVQPPANARFDITTLPAETALAKIIAAFDRLYARSPLSAIRIDRLKKSGRVEIRYDPTFPKSRFASLMIAGFFPAFEPDRKTKKYLAIVGRYGAKWPQRELAAVLAHELIGHGMQYFRGDTRRLRIIDLECEAYLYEENAYQKLGFDKHSREMIKFRKTLERKWCLPFRDYLKKYTPGKVALWERLNPDVVGLLEAFLGYLDHLQSTGVTAKARRAREAGKLRPASRQP